MPWKDKTVERLRKEFVEAAKTSKNFSSLCREFGISRKTGYKWVERNSQSCSMSGSAVLAVDIGTALVFIVFAALFRAVLLTELSVTEIGTAGMRTRTQRFLRHRFTSLGIRKVHKI